MVKSPRWSYVGDWEQCSDHISNSVPKGISNEDLQEKYYEQTYTSMLLKKKLKGNFTLSSTMSFDYQMAPLLVVAPDYGTDSQESAEYRDHFEIVLFNEGLNIWHHYYEDGKPYWRKAAFMDADFKACQKYTVTVDIEFADTGPMMTVSCDGRKFGYTDDTLPEEFFVGITGCEGINRFYDFQVTE
jgi:hypothetical protein